MASSKKKSPPAPPPLPDNGTIQVEWGPPDGRKVLDYELTAIHYRLDEATGVATCTLNDPQTLNSLTTNQIWEYFLLLQHTARDDRVRVLIWTGHGRAFSSGADLSPKARKPSLDKEVMAWFVKQGFSPGMSNPSSPDMALKSLTLAFWDFPKPSIVAVNGLSVGGAANLCLANCHDIVLCSTEGKFKFPFASLGFVPELGSSYIMPATVGFTRAKYMMMVGEWISAEEAKQLGLVLEVCPPDDLLPRARAIAQGMANRDPQVMRLIKQVMNHHTRTAMDGVIDKENELFSVCLKALMQKGMKKVLKDGPKKGSTSPTSKL